MESATRSIIQREVGWQDAKSYAGMETGDAQVDKRPRVVGRNYGTETVDAQVGG